MYEGKAKGLKKKKQWERHEQEQNTCSLRPSELDMSFFDSSSSSLLLASDSRPGAPGQFVNSTVEGATNMIMDLYIKK